MPVFNQVLQFEFKWSAIIATSFLYFSSLHWHFFVISDCIVLETPIKFQLTLLPKKKGATVLISSVAYLSKKFSCVLINLIMNISFSIRKQKWNFFETASLTSLEF